MDLLLIVFLTLLNGVFAMSELAVASSRKARLTAMEESGDAGAGAALKLMEQPTQFLSTVQVGITSIGMLNGIVGEAAFSGPVAAWLTRQGLGAGAASFGVGAFFSSPLAVLMTLGAASMTSPQGTIFSAVIQGMAMAYSTSLAKSARRERSPRANWMWPPCCQPLKRSTT